ncbi:hypothetical protein OH799_20575 [Nocardia sp. NBC_00881]|uniref:hypothetical protein n=1 Tax=Nocardia sp. NBC_00881 TaxID=2975995 RepID=UPI0038689B02|nr:hypothetical protein OH799_20575 [Nocardia sp. NBC_00881]
MRDQPGISEQPVADGVEFEPGTRQLAQLPAPAVRMAAQVAARLGAELNCLLGVRELCTATAVTELAELIERAGGSGGASLVAQLRARPRPPLVPLDTARRRSTAALHTDADGPFSRLRVQVRERDIAAFLHAGVPFGQRVEVPDLPRSSARPPLFEVLLAFGNAEAIAVELPVLSVATSTLDTGVTEFDLQLTVTEYSAGAGLGEGPASAGIPGNSPAPRISSTRRGTQYARGQARFLGADTEEVCLRGPAAARGLPCAVRTFGRALRRRPLAPAGGRLSPTRDLMWWTRSGAKRFSGRTDHQVRVRGLRSNSVTSTPSSYAYAVDGNRAQPCGGCLAPADDPGLRAGQDRPRQHRGADGPHRTWTPTRTGPGRRKE